MELILFKISIKYFFFLTCGRLCKGCSRQQSACAWDKREMREVVSLTPCDWRNAEETEGSCSKHGFHSSMASPWPLQEQDGFEQIAANDNPSTNPPPPKQSRARRRRYVIHTCIYHRSLTGARVHSALRNLNLWASPKKTQQSSKSTLCDWNPGWRDGNCCSDLSCQVM